MRKAFGHINPSWMTFQLSFHFHRVWNRPISSLSGAHDIFVDIFLPLFVLKTHLNFYLLKTTYAVNKNGHIKLPSALFTKRYSRCRECSITIFDIICISILIFKNWNDMGTLVRIRKLRKSGRTNVLQRASPCHFEWETFARGSLDPPHCDKITVRAIVGAWLGLTHGPALIDRYF